MALDSTEGSLKERGVRLTRQRQILLELIDKTGEHLDAERLYQMAKEKDPKLNRVTVYRTLKMLKAGGLVDELDLMHYGGDQHYYETRLKQEHAHVICLRCGKVEEFFGEPLQRLRQQIESHFGFQVLLARTEVGGYCAHCQTLRAREVEDLRILPTEPDGSKAKPKAASRKTQPGAARLNAHASRCPARRRTGIADRDRPQRPSHQRAARSAALSHRRAPESNLIIRDSRASRTHARILVENGEYVVEDCGSRHGTFVNGKRIERHTLQQYRPDRVRRARFLPARLRAGRRGAEAADGTGGRGGQSRRRRAWAAIWPNCAPFWTWPAPCKAPFRWTTCWFRWWIRRWPLPAPSAAF